MALDIFGNTLYTGDVVVFADGTGDGGAGLEVYEVEEVIDSVTVRATMLSSGYHGSEFYLQNTDKRCALIRNVYKTANASSNDTLN